MPGAEHAEAVDADGRAALSVLRALGMPGVAVAVQGGAAGGSSMKERSAAKKRAEKAVCAEVRVRGVGASRWGGGGGRSGRTRRCAQRCVYGVLWRGAGAEEVEGMSGEGGLRGGSYRVCCCGTGRHTYAGHTHSDAHHAYCYCLLMTVTCCVVCIDL